MGNNLTGQLISATYEQLVQISGSTLTDGTGSNINNLTVTVTNATNAVSASHALNSDSAISASYAVVTDTAVSASFATNATSASQALTSNTAISSSYAANATSASYATNALSSSYAQFAGNVNTGSLLVTASISDATTTFTKGDGSTFALTVNNVVNANSASVAISASYAATATSASHALVADSAGASSTAISASHAVNADNAISASYAATATSASHALVADSAGASSTAVSASYSLTATSASHALNADNSVTASYVENAVSSSYSAFALSSSYSATATSASHALNADSANTATTATSASHAINADSAISASHAVNADSAISASYATNSTSASHALIADDLVSGANINITSITASTGQFTNLYATSASFGYVNVTTGSAVIIGDAFIILNADTPTAPYAGIMVYDTGSASTASLEWNGNNDYWITVEENGDSAVILTGISGSKGTEALPGLNKLLKGQGNNTVADSTITDNGTLVTIQNNVSASGFVSSSQFVGNLTGTATNATSASYALNATSASYAQVTDTATSSSYATNALSASHAVNADTSVSSSYSSTALSASYSTTATSASHAVNADTSISASYATNALSSSYALTASFVEGGIDPFPYTGNVGITGNINLTGSYNRLSGSFSGSAIDNITDVYSPPKVNHVVSLTQAEYNAVSASADPNTLYYITDAPSFVTSASYATNALSSSYAFNATTASFALNATPGFPYTGSAGILGTLNVQMTASNVGTIESGSFSGTFVTNIIPTASIAQTQIEKIVTLDAATYASLSGSGGTADNTLYIVSDSTGSVIYDTIISGSVRGEVNALSIASNTASLDCSVGNFFTLTLVDGTDTFVNPSNILPGQTINLKVVNGVTGTGTISFANSVLQPSGSVYTATTGSDVYDIVTMISFDNANLSLSAVKNFV